MNLARDVAVNSTIDGLGKKRTKRIFALTRQKLYEELREQKKGVSAAVVYDLLWERYFAMPEEECRPEGMAGAPARERPY